ncbi:MAG: hypothetical protein A4E20_13930 [Nitrospira sp. SG-bin2]|uniref:winged helix-turn-helix domain-containing protein n=1 Tax=Nitrospira cf. moscoviensis SBR1015 TaxID=96242 RepID=UPI000A0DC407|nr:winged helix-turn-helix domain-containing protein [Nitrospira cf. moscoviensis SBR1015]OQW32354.1 MAG: hypothetical protein A4E20_13930 [Nitrospira sp. SG-bin2]
MDTNRKTTLSITVVALKPVQMQKDRKELQMARTPADREEETHDIRPMLLRENNREVAGPLFYEIPVGGRIVMLPVFVAAYEDQLHGLYGREGSERTESVSASDQGGIHPTGSSLETPNSFCSEPSRYVYGALMMDISRHEVLIHGQEVELTRKEFHLLKCLLKHPGHVRSRDVLLNAVWGYDYYGTARTVDVHIRRLKQKLPLLDRAIVCVRGLGYKLKDTRDEEAGIPGERYPGRGLAKESISKRGQHATRGTLVKGDESRA